VIRQVIIFLATIFGFTWRSFFLFRPLAAGGAMWAGVACFLPVVRGPTVVALLLVRLFEGRGAVRREVAALVR
jgi:hypothetical protein